MTIQLRRDTAANWSASNPVLSDGQPGYDKTNGLIKIGDGVTAWNSLASFTAIVSDGDKGDITVSGSGTTWTIDNDVVTFAKIQNVSTSSFLGRQTAGTGDVESLTTAQAKTLLAIAAADVSGLGSLATASSVDLSTQATGTLHAAQAPAYTGDATSSAGSLTLTIPADTVTNSKLANMAANTIKGNNTGGIADPTDLTASQVTALLDAFTSVAKGLAPASGGGTSNFLRADGSWSVPSGISAAEYYARQTQYFYGDNL
jgi:hypothetical protein